MKKVIIICDGCGKEIRGLGHIVVAVSDMSKAEDLGLVDLNTDRTYCDKCMKKMERAIEPADTEEAGEAEEAEDRPAKKGGRLSYEKREAIISAYANGSSTGEIALVQGLSLKTVVKALQTEGFGTVEKGNGARRLDISGICALKRAGNLPDSEIAADHHIPEWVVRHVWDNRRDGLKKVEPDEKKGPSANGPQEK